jgi:2-iminobutanoate/2-iminopropanoate deaminase
MKTKLVLLVCFCIGLSCSFSQRSHHIVSTTEAPAAIGPYSQAVRVDDMLFLSGQLGIDPETGNLVEGGFEAQARQALNNQKTVCEAAGFSLQDVVQCQVFVKDLSQYQAFNAIYSEFFKKEYPARAVLEVSRIPKDALVEIMMTAVKPDKN